LAPHYRCGLIAVHGTVPTVHSRFPRTPLSLFVFVCLIIIILPLFSLFYCHVNYRRL